jgi:hypothetical protein
MDCAWCCIGHTSFVSEVEAVETVLRIGIPVSTTNSLTILNDMFTRCQKQFQKAQLIGVNVFSASCKLLRNCRTPLRMVIKQLLTILLQFRDLNELPVDIDISLLENGSGIEESLLSNDAKCHKSCRLKINNTKLERIKRRRSNTISDDDSHQNKRARNPAGVGKEILCFFCDENAGTEDLHEATTFQLDANVRRAATELQYMSHDI